MKLLLEISDATLGIGKAEQLDTKYIFRKSARVILTNNKGEVALQHLTVPNYYKLPGGGVEQGESIEAAATREVLEEVGCDVELGELVGTVIEYRNDHELLHLSYCFVARVAGEIGRAHLEPGEVAEGQTTIWVLPEEALKLVRGGKPETYNGKFIVVREEAFLQEALDQNLL